MDIRELLRENIRTLAPYSTARDEYQGELGIYLDANENPYDNNYNRYPDPHQKNLKRRLAEIKGVPVEKIFIGNGSDEPIDLVFRLFCEPRRHNAVSIAPTYGMYKVAAAINDVQMREVQLEPGFTLDAEKLLAATDENTRLLFLCSPNNPSGNCFPKKEIEKVIRRFNGIVILDEAYIDFAGQPGFLSELDEYPNLVILQTLSKAWGMAGLRLGLAFAQPLIVDTLSRVKYPYNINVVTQKIVLEQLRKSPDAQIAEIVSERGRVLEGLAKNPVIRKIHPTDANFVLVEVDEPRTIYDRLIGAGIIVRDRSRIKGCEGCLRITIGTPEENDRLLETLKKLTMKRVLFIDRDGTLIKEPPVDYQVDSFEKLEFMPGAITAMSRIATLGYELAMATNQDGLGTASFPEATFWPAHNLMLKTFEGEGVRFDDILIDRSMPADNAPTRKPLTGMFGKYLGGDYDLKNSLVIGDRTTDIELARNLGAKGILLQPVEAGRAILAERGLAEHCVLITDDWNRVWQFLRAGERTAEIARKTRETDIRVAIDLDGSGSSHIDTGLKFFDHMLEQIVHHAGVSLIVEVKGDLEVDEHHTIEDTAIVLGEAVYQALGSKLGIERYGFCLPMDECRASVLIDFGGRIDFDWNVPFRRERIGDVPTEMFRHFFKSFADAARCNLHIAAEGENEHHKIEGVFKAFSRALRMAIARNGFKFELPSSKGVL